MRVEFVLGANPRDDEGGAVATVMRRGASLARGVVPIGKPRWRGTQCARGAAAS
jgi:hypothetical protein